MHGRQKEKRKKKNKNLFSIRNIATQILNIKFIHFEADSQPTNASGILYFNFLVEILEEKLDTPGYVEERRNDSLIRAQGYESGRLPDSPSLLQTSLDHEAMSIC